MAGQKKDLFSQIGNDILKAVVNRVVPKPRGKGRPKKVSWENWITNAVVSSKIALPSLGVWVLLNKGLITGEQATMVIHYVTANRDLVSIPELYPTSPNWVVRKALEEFGLDVSQVNVTWDEIMYVVAQLAQAYQIAHQQAGQVGLQADRQVDVDEIVKNLNNTVPGFGKAFAGFTGFTGPVVKPTNAPAKNVDKTGKSD